MKNAIRDKTSKEAELDKVEKEMDRVSFNINLCRLGRSKVFCEYLLEKQVI